MKLQGLAGMAIAMAMMSEASFGRENEPKKFKPSKTPKKVIQKGCKEFLFDKDGNLPNQYQVNNGEVVFTCIASNSKNAIKKFNAFIRSNQAE